MGLKYHKKYVFITRLMTNPIFKGYFSQAFCKVLCSQKRPSGLTILTKNSMLNTLSKCLNALFGL